MKSERFILAGIVALTAYGALTSKNTDCIKNTELQGSTVVCDTDKGVKVERNGNNPVYISTDYACDATHVYIGRGEVVRAYKQSEYTFRTTIVNTKSGELIVNDYFYPVEYFKDC